MRSGPSSIESVKTTCSVKSGGQSGGEVIISGLDRRFA